jgi:hypothetical protein
MTQIINNIQCPNCGYSIDVQDTLHHQIEDDLRKKYAEEAAKKEAFYQSQQQALEQQKQTLAAEKIQQDKMFANRIEAEKKTLHQQLKQQLEQEQSARVQALQQEIDDKSSQLKEFNKAKADIARLEREKEEQKAAIEAQLQQRFSETLKQQQQQLRQQLTQELEEQQSARLTALETELNAKSNQLKEFNKAKADILRLEREKDELREAVVLEKEREFSDKLRAEKEKIQKQTDEASHLKIKELQLKLEEQTRLADEMKRKAEQGSMQTQGEVQELAIEEWLKSNFPLDTIEEIKKGERGADCLQIIHTRLRQNCGSIYYESKRTKAFQSNWLEKFRNDIRDKNATLGVLVTEVMPVGMERMGLKDGVWICTFEEFKGLSAVLRQSVIQLSDAKLSQENKGDKMEMLYGYLTSNEFKLQIEAIVEGFSQMRSDLDAEKRAMARIWKQREKQLEKVLLNTTQMHGAIRGIAGSAVQPVALLELDSTDPEL